MQFAGFPVGTLAASRHVEARSQLGTPEASPREARRGGLAAVPPASVTPAEIVAQAA